MKAEFGGYFEKFNCLKQENNCLNNELFRLKDYTTSLKLKIRQLENGNSVEDLIKLSKKLNIE